MKMNDKNIKYTQEQAVASWVQYLNTIRFENLINSLNEQDKKILLYSIEQNMSQQEIASILNTNQVQVSRTLTKIKNNLKNKIVA